LVYKQIPLEEVLRYPLVLCHPEQCEGCSRQIGRVLRTVDIEPRVVEHVMTHDLLLTLIAAGYGVGLTSTMQIDVCRHPGVVARPLAGDSVVLTTYLLRPDIDPSAQLRHFVDRVKPIETPVPSAPT
jgi:DNA-binding transcriptional LysR family regulator